MMYGFRRLGDIMRIVVTLLCVGFVTLGSSIADAGLVLCTEGAREVVRRDVPCDDGTKGVPITPAQARAVEQNRVAASLRQQAPSDQLAQLQATCPQQFDRLAAYRARNESNLDAIVIYKTRLSLVNAKCSVTTLDCYRNFDELERSVTADLDDISRVKQMASAYRAKCGVREESKTRLTCRPNPGGAQHFGMTCR